MAYLTQQQLNDLGFKKLGINVKISDKSSIYNCSEIEIGDNSRIDDFCILSGKITIGKNCHITPMCLIAGGLFGIYIDDYSTLAYGVKVFSQSDDYSGETMFNSLIPAKYKKEFFSKVTIKKYVIVGANSTILPGVTIEEGCSIGAMSLILKDTQPWNIYAGVPAKIIKKRSTTMLSLVEQFEKEIL